ncbi:MAG: hypothetical protein P1V97_35260, partial [Planctomycetota bacterium]|nr:hypothetical protein [Planctomycetota bacterium]
YVYKVLPPGWEFMAIFPLMASGYGFCQESAKTDDAFVGFPSYWNILVLYLFVLESHPWVNVGIIAFLALMVFVPIHYIYPSRTRLMMPYTIILGSIWGMGLIAVSISPKAPWSQTVMWISLFFPVYYTALSLVHHKRIHEEYDRQQAEEAASVSIDPQDAMSAAQESPASN